MKSITTPTDVGMGLFDQLEVSMEAYDQVQKMQKMANEVSSLSMEGFTASAIGIDSYATRAGVSAGEMARFRLEANDESEGKAGLVKLTTQTLRRMGQVIAEMIKKIIKYLTDSRNSIDAKLQVVDRGVQALRTTLEDLRRNDMQNRLGRGSFTNPQLFVNLSNGKGVRFDAIRASFGRFTDDMDKLGDYVTARLTPLEKFDLTKNSKTLESVDEVLLPIPPRFEVTGEEESPGLSVARGLDDRYVVFVGDPYPGNKSFVFFDIRKQQSVGTFRGSGNEDQALPYVGNRFGLHFTDHDPRIDTTKNFNERITALNFNEARSMVDLIEDTQRSLRSSLSLFSGLGNSLNRLISEYTSPSPTTTTERRMGYMRDYVIGNAKELAQAITQSQRYGASTCERCLQLVRQSIELNKPNKST